jgi:hypothetical protein
VPQLVAVAVAVACLTEQRHALSYSAPPIAHLPLPTYARVRVSLVCALCPCAPPSAVFVTIAVACFCFCWAVAGWLRGPPCTRIRHGDAVPMHNFSVCLWVPHSRLCAWLRGVAWLPVVQMIGEDPSRPGLRDTPLRMAKALVACTSGYGVSIEEEVGEALFDVDSDDLVLVKDIDVFSLCEHHLLPFFGRVSGVPCSAAQRSAAQRSMARLYVAGALDSVCVCACGVRRGLG